MNITDYLHESRANAIPARELARLCNFKSIRQLQAHIHSLRKNNIILSSSLPPYGYYLPDSENPERDIKEFVRHTNARARHTFAATTYARRYLKGIEQEDKNEQR